MKTAVSIPDDLFDAIDECARRLRMTRSGLLAIAARQFVAGHKAPVDATQAWNAAIRRAGQPGDDPAAKAMRRRSKRIIRERR
jgi:predicted transcriptional regulator